MPSTGNVPAILERIRSASTPPRFTHEFLKANLGFSSSSDRSIIKVLKQLGFLSSDGTPTARYNMFRGPDGNRALALGLREGWAPLFLSDENIHKRSGSDLIGVVRNVTGAGDSAAKKIALLFRALATRADWDTAPPATDSTDQATSSEERSETPAAPSTTFSPSAGSSGDIPIQLHHDIHLHLPPTSDVSVYIAIFRAMKSELL